jgi:hypothetical protein
MDVLTEADKAATPGIFYAIIMISLTVAVILLGRSLIKRMRNLKDRTEDCWLKTCYTKHMSANLLRS